MQGKQVFLYRIFQLIQIQLPWLSRPKAFALNNDKVIKLMQTAFLAFIVSPSLSTLQWTFIIKQNFSISNA